MPILSTTKLSAQRFLMLGEDPPGVRLELVEGEIAVSPRPTNMHSYIDRMLSHFLITHILQRALGVLIGDVDVVLDDENVRCPDIIIVAKQHAHLVDEHSPLEIIPTLVIEIISPSSATIDRIDKFALYQRRGIPHYWLIDPHARTLEAFTLDAGVYRLARLARDQETASFPPFPDLPVPLAKLWLPTSHQL